MSSEIDGLGGSGRNAQNGAYPDYMDGDTVQWIAEDIAKNSI